MPAKSKAPGTPSKSEADTAKAAAKAEKAAKTKQTRKNLHDKRFKFDDEEFKTPLKESLKQKMFKKMIDTIKLDIKNMYKVAIYTYGVGEYNPPEPYAKWTKAYSRSVLREVLRRMDLIPEYHRVKRASNGTTQLQRPFYVFQNFHDLVNEVNMGNGLARLLIHFEWKANKKEPDQKGAWEVNVQKFVEYANASLGEDDKTSIQQIANTLLYFHDVNKTTGDAKETSSTFEPMNYKVDDSGTEVMVPGVSNEDPILRRIVDIHNAYVTTYNSRKHKRVPPIIPEEVTYEQAAIMSIPQNAYFTIPERKVMGSDGKESTIEERNVFTNKVFNVEITGAADGAQHTTSTITSGMSTIILSLITNANKIEKVKGPNGKFYTHYDLFAKYFNNKEFSHKDSKGRNVKNDSYDETYEPGKNSGFWLDDKEVNLGINTKLSGEALSDNIKAKYPSVAGSKKSSVAGSKKSSEEELGSLAKMSTRVSLNYGKDARNPPLTIFELIDELKSKKKKGVSFMEKTAENPNIYGITNFSATQLVFLSKIPKEFLSEGDQKLLEDQDSKRLVKDVQTFLSDNNMAYYAYASANEALTGGKTPTGKTPTSRKPRRKEAVSPVASPLAKSPKKASKPKSKLATKPVAPTKPAPASASASGSVPPKKPSRSSSTAPEAEEDEE